MNALRSFRELHAGGTVLVLPNAWDGASAALFRSAGAKSIATTSAGVAWSHGFADGDLLPRENLLFAVRVILRVCKDTPVTVDLESGFSRDPQAVAHLVIELAELGVAGINLEDASDPPELLAEKITAIKHALAEQNHHIFINARTDVYLRDLATGEDGLEQTVSRAKRYAAAGADGIFVPMLITSEEIETVARATSLPLNVLAAKGLPSLGEMYELGVRRVSCGSAISKAAYGTARRHAARLLREGVTEALFAGDVMDYTEMNALLTPGKNP